MAPTLKVKPCEAFSKIYFKHNCCVKLSKQFRKSAGAFFRIVSIPRPFLFKQNGSQRKTQHKKSRLHIIRIFLNQNRYFTAGLFLIISLSLSFKEIRSTLSATGLLFIFLSFSYHYPSKRSEVLFLLPDFLNFLSFFHKSPKYFLLLPDFLSNYYLQKEPEVLLLLTDSLS